MADNLDRKQRGQQVVNSYIDENGGDDDEDCALIDVLTDLLHEYGTERFDTALNMARMHYAGEH